MSSSRTGRDEGRAIAIRPATRADAPEIARLFLISSDGIAAYVWSRIDMPGKTLEEIGAARYARTGTEFSYRNCLMAEREGAVAGMVHAYPMTSSGPPGEDFDPVLRPYAELEDAGSLYVSGLAVDAGYRGQGIGGALMDRIGQKARADGLPRISLICFERNERALDFYRRRGFREIARRPIVPHPFLHYADGDALLMVADTGAA